VDEIEIDHYGPEIRDETIYWETAMRSYSHNIQRYALCLYLFSLNYENFNLYGLGSTSRFTGVLYLATMLTDIRSAFNTKHIMIYIAPAFLFWIYLTFASFVNLEIISFHFLDTTILLNILLFWVFLNHQRIDPNVLKHGMLWFGIGAISVTLFYFMGVGIEINEGRVSLFDDNENETALRISIGILVLLYFVVNNHLSLVRGRFALFFPIPAMLKFMLETGSRTAFIGFILAFFVGSLLIKMGTWRNKVVFLCLSVGASVFILNALEQADILVTRLDRTTEYGDLAGRDEIWRSIGPLIKDNLILGVGRTGYENFMGFSFGHDVVTSPHNVIIEVIAYTGIVGLTMYLTLLWRIGQSAFRSYKTTGFLLPLLLLCPVCAMILVGQALGSKIAWAIFALTAGTTFQISLPRHRYQQTPTDKLSSEPRMS